MTPKMDISSAFSKGWQITTKNALVLIGIYLLYFCVNFIIGLVPILGNIVSMIFSILFSVGYIKLFLNALDSKELEFSVFKETTNKAAGYFGISLLIGIACIVILIPVIIMLVTSGNLMALSNFAQQAQAGSVRALPALAFSASLILTMLICFIVILYFYARFMFAGYAYIDSRANSVMDALKYSLELTKGNVLNIIILEILFVVLNIVGMLCCCVGVLFTLVLTQAISASVYRQLSDSYEGRDSQAVASEN